MENTILILKEIVPILNNLVWPSFIIFLIFKFKDHSKIIFDILLERLKGDKLKVGGLELTSSSRKKLPALEEAVGVNENTKDYPLHYKNTVYIWHTVSRFKVDIYDLEERSQIQVIIDADNDLVLHEIKKVIYYLHPTFKNNKKEVSNSQNNFLLKFKAWGAFNMKAEVFFKQFEKPLVIYRYINLQTF